MSREITPSQIAEAIRDLLEERDTLQETLNNILEYIKRAELKDGDVKSHSLYIPHIYEIAKGERHD